MAHTSLTNTPTSSRRSVLAATAWTAPAVLAASAAPAFAASTTEYDVRVNTFQIRGTYNWSGPQGAVSGFYGPGRLEFSVRVCNDGPDVVPTGTLLSVGLGMGPYFDGFRIDDGAGLATSFLGRREVPFGYGQDTYYRSFWDYRINTPLQVGCVEMTFSMNLRRVPIQGYAPVVNTLDNTSEWKGYQIDTIAQVTPPDSNDSDSSNHSDRSTNSRTVIVHSNANTSSAEVGNSQYTPLP